MLPFQSTLLPFGPKPQNKQTKKRLCVYLLARQGIPVIFMLSYKQPRRKLSSSWWWWWWPFQCTLLLFRPEPQIKQTKNRLWAYPLARQVIPVIFILSYKRPRRKLSSSWWWWWWPFQSTLLPFGSAMQDWPMLYSCTVAEQEQFSAQSRGRLSCQNKGLSWPNFAPNSARSQLGASCEVYG